MIKAVFFDMGGVTVSMVVDEINEEVKKLFHLEEFSILGNHPHIHEIFDQFEKGTINEKAFWEQFAKNVNQPLPENWSAIFTNALKHSHFSPTVKKIILQLKQKGYVVAVLSNVPESMAKRHHRLGHYRLFHHLILSYEVGYRKPHEYIYQHALKTVNVKPEEALFIDDKMINIEKARQLGMQTILFKNPTLFMKELKKYLDL